MKNTDLVDNRESTVRIQLIRQLRLEEKIVEIEEIVEIAEVVEVAGIVEIAQIAETEKNVLNV